MLGDDVMQFRQEHRPRTDPCGTPYGTSRMCNSWPLYATCCVPSVTNDVIQLRTMSSIPKFRCSRSSRSEWSTQSNADVRSSIKPNHVARCRPVSAAANSASDITRNMAVSVQWCADWLLRSMSLVVRYSCSWWATTLSTTFDMKITFDSGQTWAVCSRVSSRLPGHWHDKMRVSVTLAFGPDRWTRWPYLWRSRYGSNKLTNSCVFHFNVKLEDVTGVARLLTMGHSLNGPASLFSCKQRNLNDYSYNLTGPWLRPSLFFSIMFVAYQ